MNTKSEQQRLLRLIRSASGALDIQRMDQVAGAAHNVPELQELRALRPQAKPVHRTPARHTAYLSAPVELLRDWHRVTSGLMARHTTSSRSLSPHYPIVGQTHDQIAGWQDADGTVYTHPWRLSAARGWHKAAREVRTRGDVLNLVARARDAWAFESITLAHTAPAWAAGVMASRAPAHRDATPLTPAELHDWRIGAGLPTRFYGDVHNVITLNGYPLAYNVADATPFARLLHRPVQYAFDPADDLC